MKPPYPWTPIRKQYDVMMKDKGLKSSWAPTDPMCRWLWKWLGENQPIEIADLGAGFSSLFFRLWANGHGIAGWTWTADHDSEWVDLMRETSRKMGLGKFGFRTLDTFWKRAPARYFDLVFVDFGPTMDDRLRNAWRCASRLAPGGILLVDDWRGKYRGRMAERLRSFGMEVEIVRADPNRPMGVAWFPNREDV